jgi:hypothetical protein
LAGVTTAVGTAATVRFAAMELLVGWSERNAVSARISAVPRTELRLRHVLGVGSANGDP